MARRVDLGSVIGPQGPQGPQGNPGKDLSDEINDLESKVNNLEKRTNSGVFHKCGHVVTVNAWGEAAANVIFNITSEWWPVDGRGTASGWCYRSDLNQYYPCVAQWDANGKPSAYAIAVLEGSSPGNNYTIYSEGVANNLRLFTLFISGSWIAN